MPGDDWNQEASGGIAATGKGNQEAQNDEVVTGKERSDEANGLGGA